MSKIGKINISIPEKVKVALAGNILNIEGPLGKKSLNIDLEIFSLDIKEGKEISIKPKKVDDHVEKIILDADILASLMFGLNVGVEFAKRLKHELRFEGGSKQLFSGFLKFLDNKSLYLDSSKKSC